MVVVVDTCSLHRLVEYYLPLDKKGVLVPLFKSLFEGRQILMTEFVYEECQRMAKGVIIKKLPFMSSAGFKKNLIKAEAILPDQKLLRIVLDHFTIKAKYNSLKPEQQETQKSAYLQSGDFSLMYCAYQKKKRLNTGLFPEDLKILTDESGTENGNSCFKKIPTCCAFLGVDTLNIKDYLEIITHGKIELIIAQE